MRLKNKITSNIKPKGQRIMYFGENASVSLQNPGPRFNNQADNPLT